AGRMIAVCFWIISRMSCGVDISADEEDTRTLKSAAIFACACATSSGLPNPLRTMSEPAAASARAMPSPIPLVEPVTSDTLPASVGPAATFSGLMATFMAPQPPGWDMMNCLDLARQFAGPEPRNANADWLTGL